MKKAFLSIFLAISVAQIGFATGEFERAKRDVSMEFVKVAGKLSFDIPKNSSILILPLLASDELQPRNLEIDRWFVNAFGSALKNMPNAGYKIILRNKLEEAMAELKFQSSDLASDTNKAKLGRFLGAQAIISGKREIMEKEGLVSIRLTAYKVETTELITSEDFALPINMFTRSLLQRETSDASHPAHGENTSPTNSLFSLNRRDFNIDFSTKGNKTRFKMGEEIAFRFRSDIDCYIYLLAYESSGNIKFLYPNRYGLDNFVGGGRTIELPFTNAGFGYVAAPPAGEERLVLIATSRPIPNLNWLVESGLKKRSSNVPFFETRDLRNIAIVKKELGLLASNQLPSYISDTSDTLLVSTARMTLTVEGK